MFTVYSGYSDLEGKNKNVFFAGANTDRGFVSSYDGIADERECERVYVIKGGSGTGKSSFMRYLAQRAEDAGYVCEYFLCGSDPTSLDCVKIDGRIAILDGTAPHVRDMIYPGAASELIDVSRFWDCSVLEKNKDEIVSLCSSKSEAYSETYKLLSAAGILNRVSVSLANRVYLTDKAQGFIDRLLARMPKSEGKGRVNEYYSHALTMKGAVKSGALSGMGEISYRVRDCMNTAQIFMKCLVSSLEKKGYSLTVTHLPISDAVSGVYIAEMGVSVIVGEGEGDERIINLARFADKDRIKEVRGEMKLNGEILESVMGEAACFLKKASEYHFALEKIYVSAMDFMSLGEDRDITSLKILERLREHS